MKLTLFFKTIHIFNRTRAPESRVGVENPIRIFEIYFRALSLLLSCHSLFPFVQMTGYLLHIHGNEFHRIKVSKKDSDESLMDYVSEIFDDPDGILDTSLTCHVENNGVRGRFVIFTNDNLLVRGDKLPTPLAQKFANEISNALSKGKSDRVEEIVLAKCRAENWQNRCEQPPFVYAFTSHEMDKLEHYWRRIIRQEERLAEFERDSVDMSESSFDEEGSPQEECENCARQLDEDEGHYNDDDSSSDNGKGEEEGNGIIYTKEEQVQADLDFGIFQESLVRAYATYDATFERFASNRAAKRQKKE
jgi:hypothetical protein